ncbi:MAG: hypothetical protein KDD55_00955 [Bdellovibrionales bacterium]|nr:hypothetical protein [Bdellovibrionales bacterium]
MAYLVVLIVGIVTAVAAAGLLFFAIQQNQGGIVKNLKRLETEHEKKSEFKERIEGFYSEMVDLGTIRQVIAEVTSIEEALKAERGRITITQAELETVETRLRELEEIERELEASGIETKEEFSILQKKQQELATKNTQLKEKIQASLAELDNLMQEVELNSQMQEQVMIMKTELLQTEEKIDLLLLQVEDGNEQYFILKKRYDALDIEYAQLYEKFAEAEDEDEE